MFHFWENTKKRNHIKGKLYLILILNTITSESNSIKYNIIPFL